MDGSAVLAEHVIALVKNCNNQQLSPWGLPLFCDMLQ